MSENNRRRVINADTVIINADEVIVIEANDRRRRKRDHFGDVAGVEDRRRERDHDHDRGDVQGVQDDDRKRRFPW